MKISQVLTKEFRHPSVVLWRTRELEIVRRNLNKIKKWHPVLDLGCGEGKVANTIFGKKFVDTGVDLWEIMIESAKKSRVYHNVVLGDARNLPFKDKSFQVVFSNSVIEHITGIDKVISEASRVLKKGGCFVFTVPNNRLSDYLFFRSLTEKIHLGFLGRFYSYLVNKQLCHVNLFSERIWQQKLSKNSMKINVCQSYLTECEVKTWDIFRVIFFCLSPINKSRIYEQLQRYYCQKLAVTLNEIPKDDHLGACFLIIAKKI